ncbi:hypothetical protein [Sulfurospirillum arsenophilum]|uniref:hypothetical protein n=1 Tax=Sulfurospirillum arsenophilum TaxID=56698 RepID=UPI0005AAF5C8|nr:hypothetical protein [Sulfurospirillum arsenophilum]
MTFLNSLELLAFHNVAYTIYALLIIAIIAWFGYNLTRKEVAKPLVRIPFYVFIAFLVAAGVGHHIFTYNVVPWVAQDIMRESIKPDQVYKVVIEKHQFQLPSEKLVVECGQKILFDVTSKDLVYGFGLFRKNGTMVTQMQVNPGSKNTILWTFHDEGVFDLMSTEYSGPKGNGMFVPNIMEVRGCKTTLSQGGSK